MTAVQRTLSYGRDPQDNTDNNTARVYMTANLRYILRFLKFVASTTNCEMRCKEEYDRLSIWTIYQARKHWCYLHIHIHNYLVWLSTYVPYLQQTPLVAIKLIGASPTIQ